MQKVSFTDYYGMVLLKLKKNKKRDKNYFDMLDLLVGNIILNNDFTELEKIDRLREIVYTNGSLTKKELKEIEEELKLYEYYEESIR